MVEFFQHHSFLTLCLLMGLPVTVVWLLRKDLRKVMRRMALLSLPFALTEPLFYPEYWSPEFLFGLGDRWGVGIEDFIFVALLAAFSSTCWAFAVGRVLQPCTGVSGRLGRVFLVFGMTAAMVLVLSLAGVAMIYGASVIMVFMTGAMVSRRRDLAVPGVGGAGISALVYLGVCLLLQAIIPGVFTRDWHTEKFLNLFLFGVPLEELIYAGAAGAAATVFYPYVFDKRFVSPAAGCQRGGGKV